MILDSSFKPNQNYGDPSTPILTKEIESADQNITPSKSILVRSPPVPLTERTLTILKYTRDHLLAAIQFLYIKVKHSYELSQTEQLSVNHFGTYVTQFNAGNNETDTNEVKTNGALFLSPNFSMIDENGDDWTSAYTNAKGVTYASYFDRLMLNFLEENHDTLNLDNNSVYKEFTQQGKTDEEARKDFLKEPGALRALLAENGKHILALPINLRSSGLGGSLGGRHWTVVHFNFADNTISYLDSKTPNSQATEVHNKLEQAKRWMNGREEKEGDTFTLSVEPSAQPSLLSEQKQWDSWNCGVFAIHFTALIAEGKTYDEINNIPFHEMYQQIVQRRLEIMDCVKSAL